VAVARRFFEAWEATRARTTSDLYLIHFLKLLREHGIRFLLELVRFFGLLCRAWDEMSANVQSTMFVILIDRIDALALRWGVMMAELARAQEDNQNDGARMTVALYFRKLLLRFAIPWIDSLSAAVLAMLEVDEKASGEMAELDMTPKKTTVEDTLNLKKHEKKLRAQPAVHYRLSSLLIDFIHLFIYFCHNACS
jgi:hypothetical protein